MERPIYLDGLSSTPLGREAREAMIEAWSEPGNPNSPHLAGERAARALERARMQVAKLIGAAPAEIVFTSGATEANNIAITGTALAALAGASDRRHIVVSAIEHRAVLAPAQRLREAGFRVDLAPVGRDGRLLLDELDRLVGPETALVSVMAANNETGILQPVAEAAAIARRAGALFHCDAAQIAGKLPIDVVEWDVDYLSLSAHKMYGPMGIGALYLAAGAPRPAPIILGGGQEQGLRAGTEPVPLAAGFGAAARAALSRMPDAAIRSDSLLAEFLTQLSARQIRFGENGGKAKRLPGTTSIALIGVDAEQLVQKLATKLMISTGAACSAGQITHSHVLDAMSTSASDISSTIRVTFSHLNLEEDAVAAAELLAEAIHTC